MRTWIVVALSLAASSGCSGGGSGGGGGNDFPGPAISLGAATDARHLAAEDGFVYWSEFSPGLLQRVDRDGGTPETLASGLTSPSYLTLTATHVFVSTVDGVRRVARTGGTPEPFADVAGGSTGLAVDGEFVYFASTNDDRLARVPLVGGSAATLASVDGPASIVLQGDSLFWGGGFTEPNSQVGEIPKSGGASTPLLPSIGYVPTLHTDGTNLYFRDGQGGGAEFPVRLLSLPIAGGEALVLADEQPRISGATIDADLVYWVGGDARDIIYAVPKGGGEIRTLAEGQTGAIFLAQDETALYWVAQGSVMRLAR